MDININLTLHPSPELLDLIKGLQMASQPTKKDTEIKEKAKRYTKTVINRAANRNAAQVAEVLALAAENYRNKDIASITGISGGNVSYIIQAHAGREGYVHRLTESMRGLTTAQLWDIAREDKNSAN